MKLLPDQNHSLQEVVYLVRKIQEGVDDINNPLYGQLDEVVYTLLDILEGEIK
jgi:hypothetical protein